MDPIIGMLYSNGSAWKCSCPRLFTHGLRVVKCQICGVERPCLTEREAVERFNTYYSPPDKRCVICRKKSTDFRFGVCFECAK